MSRIRIVCRGGHPVRDVVGREIGRTTRHRPTSFKDCTFLFVDDVGTEHEIADVISASWSCKAGQAPVAHLEVIGVEAYIDV